MATLFDLAQAYLNRALPETFKYDRTPRIGIPTPVPSPLPPEPVKKLPVQGGDNFSVYNPDPNRTRDENDYSPYSYNRAMRDTDKFGQTVGPNPDLYYQPPLTGIPGAVQGYLKNSLPGQLLGKVGSGIESLLPVNKRAIIENEALGAGIALDDIGRIVQGPGDYDSAENVMAGYNLAQITPETIQKRRETIEKTMSKPGYKGNLQERLDALDEFEEKMFGETGIKTKADIVFEDKMITKDPSLKGPDYLDTSFPGIGGITDIKGPPSIISKPKEPPTGINRPGTPSKPKAPPTGIKGPPSIISKPKPKPSPSRPGPKTPISKPSTPKGPKGPPSIISRPSKPSPNRPGGKPPSKPSTPKGPPTGVNRPGRPSTPKGPPTGVNRPGRPSTPKGPPTGVNRPGSPSTPKGPPTGTNRPGGDGGGGGGCFLKGTLITMFDGTKKPVEQVDLGNEVAIGGKVFATGKFLVKNLHDYKGIKVSGSHMVSENNKWVRVEDSEHGKLLGNEEHTVYVFGSENRRILINDILFTDYFEVNEQDKLMNNEEDFFDNWKLYAKQDSGNNVDIINAS
jgi:hypothetical protein